jgi:ribA/ribD-fused uncharacterized protein
VATPPVHPPWRIPSATVTPSARGRWYGTLSGMTMRTVTELTARVAAGADVHYLYFWGHQPQRGGGIGPGCLSQWWPSAFTLDEVTFPSAEHYMMWRKATCFDDDAVAARILQADHPQRAKALGRQVRGFDQARWESVRYDVVLAASIAKFSQSALLRDYLLRTGDRVLVEASPVDPVWGIGLAAADPRAGDPGQWLGLNLLGFALMDTRDQLRG